MMGFTDPQTLVYVCAKPVDFRKGMGSLAVLVDSQLQLNPFAEAVFVFANRRFTAVKILYWERDDYVNNTTTGMVVGGLRHQPDEAAPSTKIQLSFIRVLLIFQSFIKPRCGIISVMKQAFDLPNDIDALRDLVVKLQDKVQHLESQKAHLHEQIRLLIHKRFGANSEKYNANQADLFNEAEAYAEEVNLGDTEQAVADNQQASVTTNYS